MKHKNIQNIISIYNQYKKYYIFSILFYILNLQNPACILYLWHISIWIGHISSAHMWLVGTLLHGIRLEEYFSKFSS